MESANYLDIEIEEEQILITAMVKVKQKEKNKVVSFNQSVKKLATYQLPKTLLKASRGKGPVLSVQPGRYLWNINQGFHSSCR